MIVRAAAVAFLLTTALRADAGASTSGSAPITKPAGGSYRLAQACGWYAISVCSRGRRGARRAANRYGGYVIDTSSEAYPNFRPGWYCAVVGPTRRRRAHSEAREMRALGARSAYVKNGC